eukprot:11202666-Lingulodinium_polyedra.AAC.1
MALWPTEAPHWVPPPRQVPGADANADWLYARCPLCRERRRSLIARTALAPGDEVLLPQGRSGNLDGDAMACK